MSIMMLTTLLSDLMDMADATAWMGRGLCGETDPEAFFADGPAEPAKAVCAGCPVRRTCLAYALTEEIGWGVWGGLTADEREALHDLTLAA